MLSKPSTELTLPKEFYDLPEEDQNIIFQHEAAKERRRDLDAIERVTKSVARIRCLGDFFEKEQNEITEIRKFISHVLRQGKCGKLRRKRIQSICDNMKRRAQGHEEPIQDEVKKWMRRIFNQEDLDTLRDRIFEAKEKEEDLQVRRSALHKGRHKRNRDSRLQKKRVRFADQEKGIRARENRRRAQHNRQDQLINQYRMQLRLFDPIEDDSVEIEEFGFDPRQAHHRRSESEDEESEEENGAEFVFAPGRSHTSSGTSVMASAPTQALEITQDYVDQDIEEINRLEDARQREFGTHLSQRLTIPTKSTGTQAFDPELLKRMQLKKVQNLEIDADSGRSVAMTGSEAESDSESSHDEDDDDRQLFKYTVIGAFAGVDLYKDTDYYIFKNTYRLTSAEEEVRRVIRWVQQRSMAAKGGLEGGCWSLNTQFREGLMEQHLMLGEDVDVEARLWIEKELVALERKEFRAAKRRSLVTEKCLYAVEWEKSVTPLVEIAEQEEQQEQQEQHKDEDLVERLQGEHSSVDDELFGPDPTVDDADGDQNLQKTPCTPGTPTTTATITRIAPQEIQFFTTSVLANRHAKNLYMTWHATFLRGVRNEGYRRLEDEAVEKDLEALGTWGLFSREESFTRLSADRDDDDDDDADGQHQQRQHRRRQSANGNADGGNAKVEERFKVWVRRIEVLGPGN